MSWVNKINQEKPKQSRSKQPKVNKWWSDQDAADTNVSWTNFSPAGGLANYDIKIKDSLLNKDKFEKYWSEKKINDFYEGDVDGDGIKDLLAIDKDNYVRGFNNRVTYPKSESLLPYKQNYYKQSKQERENNPFKIYLETQANIPNYKSLDKYKSSRTNSIWKQIYNWFLENGRTGGHKLTQVEAYSKQVAKLIPYAFFANDVDENYIKVIIKDPEFKQMVKDEIKEKGIVVFLPNNLTVGGMDLVTLKDSYRKAKEFNHYRCDAQTAARLVHEIGLRKEATKLRKQAHDKRKDTGFNTAFIEFMKDYFGNDSETEEEGMDEE